MHEHNVRDEWADTRRSLGTTAHPQHEQQDVRDPRRARRNTSVRDNTATHISVKDMSSGKQARILLEEFLADPDQALE